MHSSGHFLLTPLPVDQFCFQASLLIVESLIPVTAISVFFFFLEVIGSSDRGMDEAE